MMLDVADIDELVLQLGHAIPTEATLGAVEIQRLHGVINHPIAELPVLEHLRLRVRLAADAVAFGAMLFPQPKRSFVVLEIYACACLPSHTTVHGTPKPVISLSIKVSDGVGQAGVTLAIK